MEPFAKHGFKFFVKKIWSRLSGLNRRPTVYKTVALPAELSRRLSMQYIISHTNQILVILCLNLKIRLRVSTNWTNFRCTRTYNDVATISTDPNRITITRKYFLFVDISK